MRKCRCEFWDKKTETRINAVGLFHQWVPTYLICGIGPGNYTVGLIELPGGRIVEVLPTDVVFMEDQKP